MNEIRAMLDKICEILTVVGIDGVKVKAAVNNLDFDDIEDCLQSLCAEECGAKYIITRNVKDFSGSKVPPITPTDLLSNP